MTPEADLPPGFRLMRFDEVDSTSDEVRSLAEAGAEHGTVPTQSVEYNN